MSHKNNCKGLNLEASKTLTNGSDFFKVLSRERWVNQNVSVTPEGALMLCLHCDKKCVEGESSFCHKCHSVIYCSQACHETDGSNHSLTCETTALFHYVDDSLFNGQTYEKLKKKGLSENTKTSPWLNNLHHEFAPTFFPGLPFERSVIILQIVSPYPHSWRFAVLARDVKGLTTHIIFHDEQRTEVTMTGGPNLERHIVAMAPLVSCLKPGNFIILLDAWFHTFKDFTTGVRIDSLEKVHFVWKD